MILSAVGSTYISSASTCGRVNERCTSPSKSCATCSDGTYWSRLRVPCLIASPSKMSMFSSPVTSCTVPISSPSASKTFQPAWIMFQATGSGTSDRLAAEVPDRTLRGDRLRVGQSAHDAHLTGNPVFVQTREAAPHHARRRAVAERVRGAEPEAQGVRAGLHRVD